MNYNYLKRSGSGIVSRVRNADAAAALTALNPFGSMVNERFPLC
jgi:hypothetical protein